LNTFSPETLIYAKAGLVSVKRSGRMTPESSWTGDASARYWNEAWLDQLIEEAFRLMQEKDDSKTDSHK
jgi:hypothetical protein